MIIRPLGYLFSIMNLVGIYFSLNHEILADLGSKTWILSILLITFWATFSFFLFQKNNDKKILQIITDTYFITGISFILYYTMVNLFLPIKFDRSEDFITFFSIAGILISMAGVGTLFLKKMI